MTRSNRAALAAVAVLALAPIAHAEENVDAACQALGAERGEVITLGSGQGANLCWFEDAYACTLEAMQAGNCPEHGRRTTGYATEAARYCAWLGGEVTMVESVIEGMDEIDGTCSLPGGSECLIGRLYYGSCS